MAFDSAKLWPAGEEPTSSKEHVEPNSNYLGMRRSNNVQFAGNFFIIIDTQEISKGNILLGIS